MKRLTWLESALLSLEAYVPANKLAPYGLGFLYPLPFALGLALIPYFFGGVFHGLAAFLLNIGLVLYCFGPQDLLDQVGIYLDSANDKNTDLFEKQKTLMGFSPSKKTHEAARAVTKWICQAGNERQFAVVFFYILGGPLGLFLILYYRLLLLTRDLAAQPDAILKPVLYSLSQAFNIMNWVCVRLSALLYALVGNFSPAFRFWLTKVNQGPQSNAELLTNTSLLALDLPLDDPSQSDLSENKAALALVERAWVLTLFLIVILTLGAWIA